MIVESIGIATIVGVAIYAYKYLEKSPESRNQEIFDFIPHAFPTLGLLGTFAGITYGLIKFDVNDIEGSIPELIQGLSTAFYISIVGVICLLFFTYRAAIISKKEGRISEETAAIKELTKVMLEFSKNMNENFIYTDENNNKVTPANFFRNINNQLEQQTTALSSFSLDLANLIENGLEKILNNEEKGVTFELQSLRVEIEKLSKNIQEPGKGIADGAIGQLQFAMKEMVSEFKTSVSGSAKNEMENLAKTLGEAGKLLNDFPDKLQVMTDNLNNNFSGLQDVIKNIGEETFKTSDDINKKMQNDIKDMAEILKDNVSKIQSGQGNIVAEQSKNLQLSENLLSAFNDSIENMNAISSEVVGTLSEFRSVHDSMIHATNEFKVISENVKSSTNQNKIAQEQFSKYSNDFVKGNSNTIERIQETFEMSERLVLEYAEKFDVIEQGLKGIFNEIEHGLNLYQKSVGSGLEYYLSEYSGALTNTAQSLSSASQQHFEILEELSEQLSKLKK
jgi:hypothetical protein